MILRPQTTTAALSVGYRYIQPPVDLLRPYDAGEMEMKAANPAVGNVRNGGPEMLVRPEQPGEHGLWE